MSQKYRDGKERFDSMVYGYLLKRLTQPIESTDAYGTGHVDEAGNEMDPGEDWSYTPLDKLVLDLRAALGDRLHEIVKDSYADVDALKLMSGPVDARSYLDSYAPVVKLVEEAGYLPPETRGKPGEPQDSVESGLSMEQRVSFALTVATALMVSMLKDRLVNEAEIDAEVLPDTEATFGVRSVGDAPEIIGYLRSAGLSNGRELTGEGIRLMYRISRVVAEKGLASAGNSRGDLGGSWLEVSRA